MESVDLARAIGHGKTATDVTPPDIRSAGGVATACEPHPVVDTFIREQPANAKKVERMLAVECRKLAGNPHRSGSHDRVSLAGRLRVREDGHKGAMPVLQSLGGRAGSDSARVAHEGSLDAGGGSPTGRPLRRLPQVTLAWKHVPGT